MSSITKIFAREILDSRGTPTIEVEVTINHRIKGSFIVPSGASTGIHEAIELRDHDSKRYGGKGVLKAVDTINQVLGARLLGYNPKSQSDIDHFLIEADGTKNKSRYGANTILGLSMAVAKAYSVYTKTPLFQSICLRESYKLPRPMMNVMNGGVHADNGLDIQEFMICPKGPTFRESLRYGSEISQALKTIIKKKGFQTNVGDEGGFAPNISSPQEALDMMSEAVITTGFRLGSEVHFALDVAASELYKDGRYYMNKGKDKKSLDDMIIFYKQLVKNYPIFSIEDPFDQDDFDGWKTITKELKDIQLVGDDVFVTNKERLQMGIDQGMGNSILIKLNQVGTLSETLETMNLAQKHGYTCVVSHRSGETEDTSIADLSVAMGAPYIKTGGLSRSERIAKYNQLLRIEEILSLPKVSDQHEALF